MLPVAQELLEQQEIPDHKDLPDLLEILVNKDQKAI